MTDAAGQPYGRIAGIDFGTVRVGVAVTDPARTLASPYANYTRAGSAADARWFRRFAEDEDIRLCVVGLPVHLSGQEAPNRPRRGSSASGCEKSLDARWFSLTSDTPRSKRNVCCSKPI